MSWLDKLWENPNKKPAETDIPGVSATPMPGVTPSNASILSTPSMTTVTTANAPDTGGIPAEYVEFFEKVFTERNIPGPDFFEFFQALAAMDSLPIDEPAKFKAAFATLATQGVTVERLVETAELYVKNANDKAVEFERAVQAKSNEAQAMVEAAEAKAKAIQSQLAALQKEYEDATRVVAEAKAAQASYPDKVANFKKALDHFNDAIRSRVLKINTHIRTH